MNPLNHVAIIMDGNGRWGLKNKNSRNAGHRAGLNVVEKIIKESIKNEIKYLTLFAFSTENWKRPKKEIKFLFNLLENFLVNKIEDLHKQNIKLKIIGAKNFSSSSPISFAFKSFFNSSFASLRIFLIETLHFSPIAFISFFNSVLLSSLSSGTGSLIN